MSDDQVTGPADEALDPLDAELRSLIAERRMDEILANLLCGNTTISVGGITGTFFSQEDEDAEEPVAIGRDFRAPVTRRPAKA